MPEAYLGPISAEAVESVELACTILFLNKKWQTDSKRKNIVISIHPLFSADETRKWEISNRQRKDTYKVNAPLKQVRKRTPFHNIEQIMW